MHVQGRALKFDPMKPDKKHTSHILLLVIAFGLALSFRLIRLGIYPLGDMEAEIALQALAAAQKSRVSFGSFMSVVGLTGIDFFLFSSGNFLARFWTAFFGAGIVFIPLFFRKKLGDWPAILASLALAISPDMVGLSRIVGSPMMALVCLLLALGLFYNQKPVLSGGMLAMGLMSGSVFWLGLIILGMSGLISRWIFKENHILADFSITDQKHFWIRFGLSFIATLLIIGTVFFLAPSGLSGVFSGLISFVEGFGEGYTSPFFLIPLSLVVYALPAVIFGIWGSLRGILLKSELDIFLLVWWVLGLVILFLYPGSNPADIIWVTFPLWILAARVVSFAWHLPDEGHLVMIITSAVVFLLFAFMFLALRSLGNQVYTQEQQTGTLIAILGSAVLLVAIVLLVSFGWSEEIALPGLLLGLALVFSAGMISASVNSTSLGSKDAHSFWYPDEPQVSTKWLDISIERILDGNKTQQPPVEIAVTAQPSPAMKWALREYDPVHFEPYIPPQFQPGLIITEVQVSPELTNSYRGQDLVWSRRVTWNEMSPMQYFTWIISGKAPTLDEWIIFWVRTDLMIDEQFLP